MTDPAGSPAPSKRCTGCGLVKPLSEFSWNLGKRDGRASRCLACCREADRARYAALTPAALDAISARRRQRRKADPAPGRAASRRYAAKLRRAVFAHYGAACACCGATKRLTIDHVNGDGTEHRAGLFRRRTTCGPDFYRGLIRQGFPPGFQTLCLPCNTSKAGGPACRLNHRAAA